MGTYAALGLIVALAWAFTCLSGWSQVGALFRETEQERIDRQFFAIVAALEIDI